MAAPCSHSSDPAPPERVLADWVVDVDRAACIGTGVCTSTAPRRFTLASDGSAEAVDAAIDADPAVLAAAESCPVNAITVVEIGSGTVLAGPDWVRLSP